MITNKECTTPGYARTRKIASCFVRRNEAGNLSKCVDCLIYDDGPRLGASGIWDTPSGVWLGLICGGVVLG